MYEALKGEIARVKQLRKLTYSDIARMTGYKSNTIAQFMSGTRESDDLAAAIAKALNIKEGDLK